MIRRSYFRLTKYCRGTAKWSWSVRLCITIVLFSILVMVGAMRVTEVEFKTFGRGIWTATSKATTTSVAKDLRDNVQDERIFTRVRAFSLLIVRTYY